MMLIDFIQFAGNALLFYFALRLLQTKLNPNSDASKALAYLFH